jgi:hypothetical protein
LGYVCIHHHDESLSIKKTITLFSFSTKLYPVFMISSKSIHDPPHPLPTCLPTYHVFLQIKHTNKLLDIQYLNIKILQKNKINPTINNNNNVYKNNFSIIKKTNYYGKNGIHSVPKQLLKKTYERHDTSTRTQRTGLNGKVYEKRNGKV